MTLGRRVQGVPASPLCGGLRPRTGRWAHRTEHPVPRRPPRPVTPRSSHPRPPGPPPPGPPVNPAPAGSPPSRRRTARSRRQRRHAPGHAGPLVLTHPGPRRGPVRPAGLRQRGHGHPKTATRAFTAGGTTPHSPSPSPRRRRRPLAAAGAASGPGARPGGVGPFIEMPALAVPARHRLSRPAPGGPGRAGRSAVGRLRESGERRVRELAAEPGVTVAGPVLTPTSPPPPARSAGRRRPPPPRRRRHRAPSTPRPRRPTPGG
ncbi:hypothetical protein SDIAM26S_03087 [Streptomyces diastaticus subsp. diastaticus]